MDYEITLLLLQETSQNLDPRDVVPDGWMIDIHVFCFGKIYFLVSTSVSQNGTPYQFHRLNTSEQHNKINSIGNYRFQMVTIKNTISNHKQFGLGPPLLDDSAGSRVMYIFLRLIFLVILELSPINVLSSLTRFFLFVSPRTFL